MVSIAKLIRNRPLVVGQRVWRISLTVLAWVLVAPALAHAHGMGGEELGPPIVTSGLLGFICYWLVVLWPAAKRKGVGSSGQTRVASGAGRNSHAVRIKRKPRLRKIETPSQFPSDQNSKRRAGNG